MCRKCVNNEVQNQFVQLILKCNNLHKRIESACGNITGYSESLTKI